MDFPMKWGAEHTVIELTKGDAIKKCRSIFGYSYLMMGILYHSSLHVRLHHRFEWNKLFVILNLMLNLH